MIGDCSLIFSCCPLQSGNTLVSSSGDFHLFGLDFRPKTKQKIDQRSYLNFIERKQHLSSTGLPVIVSAVKEAQYIENNT